MKDTPVEIKKEFMVSAERNQNFSRYKKLKRLIDEEGNSYIETPEKMVIRETHKDSFYSVEVGCENRLDLISYKFYRTPFLYWAIAYANNIENPFDVPAGIVLRIPDISSIQGPGGVI